MHYKLYQALDLRDRTTALWLLRSPAGVVNMQECAYLGAAPKVKDIGRHVSQIKRTSFANPEFYVFENMRAWVTFVPHASPSTRLLAEWEVMA
jgi:hypothetical protein